MKFKFTYKELVGCLKELGTLEIYSLHKALYQELERRGSILKDCKGVKNVENNAQ